MILNAYTIYDLKAEVFHAPFFAISHGSAVRSFSDLANDLNTMVGRHPADYILYWIGLFDDSAGVLQHTDRSHIANAVQLVSPPVPLPLDNSRQGNPNGRLEAFDFVEPWPKS